VGVDVDVSVGTGVSVGVGGCTFTCCSQPLLIAVSDTIFCRFWTAYKKPHIYL